MGQPWSSPYDSYSVGPDAFRPANEAKISLFLWMFLGLTSAILMRNRIKGEIMKRLIAACIVAFLVAWTAPASAGGTLTDCNDSNPDSRQTSFGETSAGTWTFTVTEITPEGTSPGQLFIGFQDQASGNLRYYFLPPAFQGASLTVERPGGTFLVSLHAPGAKRGMCVTVSVDHP